MQDARERVGADSRKTIGHLAQDPLQSAQRPGGRAVLLAIRCATDLGQNPLQLGDPVPDWRTATMPGNNRGHSLPAQACHQLRFHCAIVATVGVIPYAFSQWIKHIREVYMASLGRRPGWDNKGVSPRGGVALAMV